MIWRTKNRYTNTQNSKPLDERQKYAISQNGEKKKCKLDPRQKEKQQQNNNAEKQQKTKKNNSWTNWTKLTTNLSHSSFPQHCFLHTDFRPQSYHLLHWTRLTRTSKTTAQPSALAPTPQRKNAVKAKIKRRKQQKLRYAYPLSELAQVQNGWCGSHVWQRLASAAGWESHTCQVGDDV